ncbi:PREDICTED: tetratricopeptide repeat protein 7B [Papilio polytes]|uniref:tetratricopeptide repeat protein 7B n=1 Tax=Papilio polytes TaxID=76194 RepID=UPI00067687FC|nr:PREDICTED: tetratricopeptide repeat protein 7B [Papilio polytes]
MTSRSKNSVRSYETEIEKNREESNWKKAVELAQQLKSRSPQHESLAHFLIGEGKLEAYFEEWPPIKENIERAQRELSEARGYLTLATDEAGKKAGVALDAHLLLGKLNYACGAYDEALKQYNLAELSTLTEKELPVRSLRIVAESYAIKGLCLEQNSIPGSTSRYKQAERESELIRSFEVSSELTLLYLQRAQAARAGAVLETALQRAPLLHIRAGRLHSAIDRYREMLTAVEAASTQALRLTLARQLAEVLMRGVTGQVYKAPEKVAMPAQGTLTRRREDHVSEGPWKPKKYAAINQFVPCNEYEEVMLLVLVGEAMAARDAVLSQSAEFEITVNNVCCRLDRTHAAAGCVAEAAALTPHSHLVLYTRGLVHAASGEWEEARGCFQNALAIHPTHLDSMVQLGSAYYELGWLRLAERALREAGALGPLRADTWRRLALVLAALGEPAAAADAAAAALALHPAAPLAPLAPPHALAADLAL